MPHRCPANDSRAGRCPVAQRELAVALIFEMNRLQLAADRPKRAHLKLAIYSASLPIVLVAAHVVLMIIIRRGPTNKTGRSCVVWRNRLGDEVSTT